MTTTNTIQLAINARRFNLDGRLRIAEAREERLSAAALAYEKATTPPSFGEEDQLDRMIDLFRRAEDVAERLRERIALLIGILNALDEEEVLSRRPRKGKSLAEALRG